MIFYKKSFTWEEAQAKLKESNGQWEIINAPEGARHQSSVMVTLPDGTKAVGNDLREAMEKLYADVEVQPNEDRTSE